MSFLMKLKSNSLFTGRFCKDLFFPSELVSELHTDILSSVL